MCLVGRKGAKGRERERIPGPERGLFFASEAGKGWERGKGTEIFLHLECFAKSLSLETAHCLRLATSLIGVSQ